MGIWPVSGNSFRHSFIERGHAVWVWKSQFAFDDCFSIVYKKIEKGPNEYRKSETHQSLSDVLFLCVCICVCIWKGDWVGVRDSDGVERV